MRNSRRHQLVLSLIMVGAIQVAAQAQDSSPARGGVVIDEGHNEGHTLTGGYAEFARSLTDAGFGVGSHNGKVSAQSLVGVAVLVIANPFPEPRQILVRKSREENRLLRWSSAANQSAFDSTEIRVIRDWVLAGGGLLLVSDHAPHGRTVGSIARTFGVEMQSVETTDSTHLDPPRTPIPSILFTRAAGTLGNHVILADVDSVVTYGGGSFLPPEGSAVLLRIPSGRVVRSFDEAAQAFTVQPATGHAQAVALMAGRGRVVLLGEAAMLTTDPQNDLPQLGEGIANTRIGNRRFGVNVVQWLAHKN